MLRPPQKRRVETEKGYVVVENSHIYGGWIWHCEWGHIGFDFEGEQEALEDFKKHRCDRRV